MWGTGRHSASSYAGDRQAAPASRGMPEADRPYRSSGLRRVLGKKQKNNVILPKYEQKIGEIRIYFVISPILLQYITKRELKSHLFRQNRIFFAILTHAHTTWCQRKVNQIVRPQITNT